MKEWTKIAFQSFSAEREIAAKRYGRNFARVKSPHVPREGDLVFAHRKKYLETMQSPFSSGKSGSLFHLKVNVRPCPFSFSPWASMSIVTRFEGNQFFRDLELRSRTPLHSPRSNASFYAGFCPPRRVDGTYPLRNVFLLAREEVAHTRTAHTSAMRRRGGDGEWVSFVSLATPLVAGSVFASERATEVFQGTYAVAISYYWLRQVLSANERRRRRSEGALTTTKSSCPRMRSLLANITITLRVFRALFD